MEIKRVGLFIIYVMYIGIYSMIVKMRDMIIIKNIREFFIYA